MTYGVAIRQFITQPLSIFSSRQVRQVINIQNSMNGL